MERATTIDPNEVPDGLHVLIPLAEKWAIRNPILRDDAIEEAPREEVISFIQAVKDHRAIIDDWLNNLPKDIKDWPNAAVEFLYVVKNWHEAACWRFDGP